MQISDSVIQAVLVTLVQILTPIVLTAVVALIKVLIDKVKAQMSAEQIDFATKLAKTVVLAAEQNGLNGELEKIGMEKKEWAILRLESELAKHDIHIDVHVLSDLIEAQVHENFKMQ